jgi:hypothetical protein
MHPSHYALQQVVVGQIVSGVGLVNIGVVFVLPQLVARLLL